MSSLPATRPASLVATARPPEAKEAKEVPAAPAAALRTRSRQLFGFAVVAAVLLLQALSQVLGGNERARVAAHLVFVATEMPVIALALSLTYAESLKRKLSPFRAVMGCVLVAGALGVVFGAALYGIAQVYPVVMLHPGRTPALGRSLLYGFTYAQVLAGLWTLAFVLPFAIDDARLRALEAEQLRSSAELARLRANLEPHFLLNTLNAIAGFVTEDPAEARKLLACLGDLLRDSLHDDDELQTLEEQVSWLRRYAAILQARHGDALRFEWEITPEAERALLPRLLLQPLVENAVKHGALCRRGGGVVRVSARAAPEHEGRVVCTVEDNGPGAGDAEVRSGAFGLHAVRRRLELRYKGATMRLESSGRGTRSIVELPVEALVSASPRTPGEARP